MIFAPYKLGKNYFLYICNMQFACMCVKETRVNSCSDQRKAPVPMTRFLLFTLLPLLLFSANANHFEDANKVLNEWDNPNLEIISPENQSSKQVGKSNQQTRETGKRKAIQDSEEKELRDFIYRFFFFFFFFY